MEPIVSIDKIRTLAQAAAHCGKSVADTNPYPEGTAAHACFMRDFWAACKELEACVFHGLNRRFF